jgi:hypothetical protein
MILWTSNHTRSHFLRRHWHAIRLMHWLYPRTQRCIHIHIHTRLSSLQGICNRSFAVD